MKYSFPVAEGRNKRKNLFLTGSGCWCAGRSGAQSAGFAVFLVAIGVIWPYPPTPVKDYNSLDNCYVHELPPVGDRSVLSPSQGWHSPAPERHCLTLIRTWPPWSHWQRSVRALQWEDECAKHNESPTADDIRITLNQLMCLIACPELNWKHWDFV